MQAQRFAWEISAEMVQQCNSGEKRVEGRDFKWMEQLMSFDLVL